MEILILAVVFIFACGLLFFRLKGKKKSEESADDKIEETSKKSLKNIDQSLTRGKIYFFYGSQSGTANKLAEQLSEESQEKYFDPTIVNLEKYNEQNYFSNDNLCIFLMATYGEGDPTDNAKDFNEWLLKEDHPNNLLNCRFVVFGLGNTQYENYNNIGKRVDQYFEKLGGRRVFPIGLGDDNSSLMDDFEEWKEKFWTALEELIPVTKKVQETKQTESKNCVINRTDAPETEDWSPKEDINYQFLTGKYLNSKDVKIKSITELRQNNDDGYTLHLVLDLSEANTKYQTAANIGIYPINDPALVERIALQQKWPLCQNIEITGNKRVPFPSPISIRNILQKFCDFQGMITKNQIKKLAKWSQNEETQKSLNELANNKKQFQEEIEEGKVMIWEILQKHDIQIDISQFVELCPRLAPRLQTISSSSLKNPDEVTVTNSLMIDQRKNGTQKVGICSQYFQYLQKNLNETIRIDLESSNFKLPETNVPIIMIGAGTGIAPFKAFLEEKEKIMEIAIDKCPGEFTLFFGCKHENGDYIFKDELAGYKQRNVLQNLYTAFSRDQEKKVYVQNLIKEQGDDIYAKLMGEDAKIYMCGANRMGFDVLQVLREIVMEQSGVNEEEAEVVVKDWEKNKTIIKELW